MTKPSLYKIEGRRDAPMDVDSFLRNLADELKGHEFTGRVKRIALVFELTDEQILPMWDNDTGNSTVVGMFIRAAQQVT